MRAKWLQTIAPVVLLLGLMAPGFAQSGPTPDPVDHANIKAHELFIDRLLRPADQDLRPAILRALQEADPIRGIEKINALLPRLSVSPLRVFLLAQRADRRVSAGEISAGRSEFESLIRQFPQVEGIKLQAIDSLAYGDGADFAARHWIDLAATNPAAARAISGYTMGALSSNVTAKDDNDSMTALFLALDRIGYNPGTTALRNEMQLAIFTNAANDTGREGQAIAALGKLTNPAVLLSIATQTRYRDYWQLIDLNAASLNARGAQFLRELEQDFLAAENGVAAGQFLSTAARFGDAQAVAKQYSRLLADLLAQSGNSVYAKYDTPFWVSPIAFAWAAADDQQEAQKQFEAVLDYYADISGTNDLNINANYAILLLELDRPREALAMIEPAIARLRSVGQSAGALAQMHSVRLRAHYLLADVTAGRDSRRHLDGVRIAQLRTYVQTMLMIDEDDMAKDAIIAGLRHYDPEQAIQILQFPLASPGSKTQAEYERKLEKLRQDPDVLANLDKVGRIVQIAPIDAGPFDHAATAGAFPSLQ